MPPRTIALGLRPDGRGTVTIDGTEISDACERVAVCADSRERVTRVEVHLAAHETLVEGEATIVLPPRTVEALVALGWTPPAGEP